MSGTKLFVQTLRQTKHLAFKNACLATLAMTLMGVVKATLAQMACSPGQSCIVMLTIAVHLCQLASGMELCATISRQTAASVTKTALRITQTVPVVKERHMDVTVASFVATRFDATPTCVQR